ncbi:hypothetical protein TWF694_002815 [Orbilia ellipsospora]|uniref:Uncharacterized protein n=1 Tax=Orbilia ellipsospora TaxID=2528407 RepID=A0AAV9WZV4_9PEZI
MQTSLGTAIPTPISNYFNYVNDFNVRHSHYRRIPNSQRSLSPPPQRRQYALKVVQSVLCLPICRKRQSIKKTDGNVTEEEEESLIVKNLEPSVISSEEQTRAPEGDRLPVFTRLKDWTEHEKMTRWNVDTCEDEDEDDDPVAARFPPRSASMPMEKIKPLTANVLARSRTVSDRHLSKATPQVAGTTKWLNVPTFKYSNSTPSDDIVTPRLSPKMPRRKSLPLNRSPFSSQSRTPLKSSRESQNLAPSVPPPKFPIESQDDVGDFLEISPLNRIIPVYWESKIDGQGSIPNQRDYVYSKRERKKKKKGKKQKEPDLNSIYSLPPSHSHDSHKECMKYHREERQARRRGYLRSPARESRKERHERYGKNRHHHHHRNEESLCYYCKGSPDYYWNGGAEMAASTPVWMPGTWRVFEAQYGWYDVQAV